MNGVRILLLGLFSIFFLPLGAQEKEDPCPLSSNKKARKLYEKAIDVVRTNKNEARGLLNEALEIDPEFGRANYMLADLLIKGKQSAEAEPYLKQVIAVCPELDPSVFYKLGSIQFAAKKYKEAQENLKRFVDSNAGKEKDRSDAREQLTAATFYIEGFAKPVPFNPTPLADISSEADEYLPVITADNQRAYFTRRTKEKEKFSGGINVEEKSVERFSWSSSLGTNHFEKGQPMPPPFNKNSNEGGASLSADNRILFYTICKQEGGELLNCDLWYSVYGKDSWSEIKNAGPSINGKSTWDSQPSLSSDGKTLYFASNRPGGMGELDIWKSVKDATGKWGVPVNLGPEINTPGNEKSPFFHSDGQTLYFSSTGHQGYGGYDIFFAKLDKELGWQKPKNIGYPINSEKDDLGFFVSTDGKTGYFASDKLKGVGGWDVYAFDLYKEARPERVVFLTGELKNENNQVVTDAKVEIQNVRTREITTIDVDSLTGKYVAVMAFNEDHILTVKQPGKASTTEYLSTADSSLNAPKKMDVTVKEIKVGQAYKINNLNFGTNSAAFNAQTVFIVQELAVFLKENPTVKIAIHGHTDNVGDPAANLKLSNERAKHVFELLLLEGIQAERLSWKGFGMTKPLASNLTDKGKAMNRRTEFVITAK
ncbi:MAG: hypothetical protein RLZZ543_1071 [Bacteroidota bacterium]